MDNSRLRCSDSERDATASKLHAHATAGRLTPDELADRLVLVSVSTLRGQLALLLDDLPDFRPLHVPADLNRCSDADREDIIARLKEHWIAGRLSPGEYEERLEIAACARKYEDLRGVLSELPKPPALTPGPLIGGRSGAAVPAPDGPLARKHVPVRTEKSVTPGLLFWGGVIGPVNSVILAVLWNHAASETWTPGTSAPMFLAAMMSVFLALPVLLMLLLPFGLVSDWKRAGR